MRTIDYMINLLVSGLLIAAGYQVYFWCQHNAPFEAREFSWNLDELIPCVPAWVWVYTILYYPGILYLNLVLETRSEFMHVAASYLLLLALQVACFLAYPVRTPSRWRVARDDTLSGRLLALVRRIDAPTNSFPSMHTSVAMLTALHLFDLHGFIVFVFPALIGLSCVFTKQHYVVDIPAGVALGGFAFALHARMPAL